MDFPPILPLLWGICLHLKPLLIWYSSRLGVPLPSLQNILFLLFSPSIFPLFYGISNKRCLYDLYSTFPLFQRKHDETHAPRKNSLLQRINDPVDTAHRRKAESSILEKILTWRFESYRKENLSIFNGGNFLFKTHVSKTFYNRGYVPENTQRKF